MLSCLFFQLALDPKIQEKLRAEVQPLFENGGEVDIPLLAKQPYLEAVINEALRLHPPVPSGVQRMTPPGGLRVGETFIPGDTIVQIPSHTIFRGTQ